MIIPKAKRIFPIFLLVSFLGTLPLARAGATSPDSSLTEPTSADYVLTTIGAGLWLGSEALKDSLVPSEPQWTTPNALDEAVRNSLKWQNANLKVASGASDLLLAGVVVPSLFWTPFLTKNDYRSHVMVGLEAVILSGVLNQGVKFAVSRQRPYSFFGTRPSKGADDYLSFYSGHSASSFAIATSTAYLLSQAHPNRKALIWSSSLAMASSVAYLRIAADKHYFTDVLVGSLIGSGIGYFVAKARAKEMALHGSEMIGGSIILASALALGRKGDRIGLAIGNRSYLDSDFFDENPEGLEPGDLRGNSYNILFETTPSPGLLGVEFLLSVDPSNTQSPRTGNDHRLHPVIARLSGKVHPLATTGLSRYFDFYVGGGATGVAFNYEITGASEDFSESYKAWGPHAVAGFEYYLGTFADGKWKWGTYVDYIFTSAKVERVRRHPKNLEDRADFNAGGHLFTFGIKLNAFR